MKNKITLLLAFLMAPFMGYAQVDDMYFIPGKEKKTQAERPVAEEEQAVTSAVDEQYDETVTYATGQLRDVDEYNRRDTWYNDSLMTQAEEENSLYEEDEEEINDDYHYSKRILRFCAPSVGVMVSSPLYWDLCYGPNSIYWDVYVDGIYAYAFPSSWSSLYWGPYFSFWWGWDPYWAWGGPWYAGWHAPYWHHPHWGHHGYGIPSRPVARPSTRYREGSLLARGSSATSGRRTVSANRLSTRSSNGTTRRSILSGNEYSPRRSSSTSTQTRSQRSTYTPQRTQSVRSSGYTPSTRSSSSPSFRAPTRSGGGGGASRGRR